MKYEKNKVVFGTVSGITEYGAFVKFDEYYSGLIHISEISDKFVSDINNFVKIGDIINVMILDVDHKNYHLKLSIKNIDYKKGNGIYNKKIIETPNKFNTLRKKLDFWIKQYLKNKKINKPY